MERSLFFIKPEAVGEFAGIAKIITDTSGLELLLLNDFLMSAELLGSLYGHISKYIQEDLVKQMLGKSCILGVVEGENAVERLVEICGAKTAPYECGEQTIRYRYGRHSPGFEHYNAIHCPKTLAEAAQNFEIFHHELAGKLEN